MTNHLVMQLRTLAFAVCVTVSVLLPSSSAAAADDDHSMEHTSVHAVANQTVRLSCPLHRSKTPRVAWLDFVYNVEVEPKRIFLANATHRILEKDHPNAKNYEVDANYTLVIRNLQIDDSGLYRCTSRSNSTRTLRKSYYLAVSGYPSCSGTNILTVGQNTSLSCEASYAGNDYPRLEWRRGQDEVIESLDYADVRLAKKVIDFEASAGDDGTTFTCRMTFGSVLKDCNVNITVLYSVRDLAMDPLKETFAVGEEIRCSANGNPAPDIFIQPDLTPGQTGVGWRSVTIPKSLEGQTTEVECIASNQVNGQTESIRKTISFIVVAGSESTDDPEKPTREVRSESASSSGAIVGGIVVGIMILLVVIAAVFYLRLRKEKKPKKEENGGTKTTTTNKDASQQTNPREQQV